MSEYLRLKGIIEQTFKMEFVSDDQRKAVFAAMANDNPSGKSDLEDINSIFKYMSSVDDPDRKLRTNGWKKVGQSKVTAGLIYKKNKTFGVLWRSFDDYGRPQYKLDRISKNDIDFYE